MNVNQLTRKELLNLPQDEQHWIDADEVIIIPTNRKHSSGFRLNAVIAPVKEEYKIIGYVDAVLIETEEKIIIRSDVLLKSNAVRYFGHKMRLYPLGERLDIVIYK